MATIVTSTKPRHQGSRIPDSDSKRQKQYVNPEDPEERVLPHLASGLERPLSFCRSGAISADWTGEGEVVERCYEVVARIVPS